MEKNHFLCPEGDQKGASPTNSIMSEMETALTSKPTADTTLQCEECEDKFDKLSNKPVRPCQSPTSDGEFLKLFRPIAGSMKCCGLLRIETNQKQLMWDIYGLTVLLIITLGVVLAVLRFDLINEKFNKALMDKLMQLIWTLLGFANACVCFYASRKKECLATVIKLQSDVILRDSTIKREAYLIKGVTYFSWLLVMAAMTVVTAAFIRTIQTKSPEDGVLFYIRTFALPLTEFYGTVALLFPAALTFCLCTSIAHAYDDVTAFLTSVTDDICRSDLLEVITRHRVITKLVDHVNMSLAAHIGAELLAITVTACLSVFTATAMASAYTSLVSICNRAFWTSVYFLILVSTCWAASKINTQAHALLDAMQHIRILRPTPEITFNMTLFLARLQGPAIGITATNLFIVDKSTILTMFGLLISYFILLVQFYPSFTDGSTCGHLTAAANQTVAPG